MPEFKEYHRINVINRNQQNHHFPVYLFEKFVKMCFGEFACGAFFVKGFLPLSEGFLVKVGLFQTVVEVFFELVRQWRTTSTTLS